MKVIGQGHDLLIFDFTVTIFTSNFANFRFHIVFVISQMTDLHGWFTDGMLEYCSKNSCLERMSNPRHVLIEFH